MVGLVSLAMGFLQVEPYVLELLQEMPRVLAQMVIAQAFRAAFEQDTNWHREVVVRGRIVLLTLHRQGAIYVLVGES